MRWTARVVGYAMLALLSATPAWAAPYWVAWEGNDYPEIEGWTRINGPRGKQANRTLEGGVLSYDSLFDISVFDFSQMKMPGKFSVGPGETFIVEWRLRVNEAYGVLPYDPGLAVFSDDDWAFGLTFGFDEIDVAFDDAEGLIPFAPGVFHAYQMRTNDFRTYTLLIDGVIAFTGPFFEPGFVRSEIGWGDSVEGARSRADWDYFRFGVVPEPSSLALFGACLASVRLYARVVAVGHSRASPRQARPHRVDRAQPAAVVDPGAGVEGQAAAAGLRDPRPARALLRTRANE